MKKPSDIDRRDFLRLLISVAVAYPIGCGSEPHKTTHLQPLLNPEESLKKLILLLGPWPESDRKNAEDFALRFLKSRYTVDPYLPGSSTFIQSLASRYPDGIMATQEIDLKVLPVKERELLLNLVKQLYSFIEVRLYLSHEPPWGECQGDRARHIKAPAQNSNAK